MEKLLKQRKVIKGKLTRMNSFLQTATTTTSVTISELLTRLDILDSAWMEYNAISNEIIAQGAADEVEAQEIDQEEVETKFITAKSGFRALIATSQTVGIVNTITAASAPPIKADIKLPRMDLPTFSGNYLEWTSFNDLFTSMIHNNTQISDAQKFHYLKNALQGEAAALLTSLDTTNANYSEGWRLLVDRYQNDRQIINCHIQNLFNQQKMTIESASELRRLLDTTVKHVRALKGLKVPVELWDHILIYIVTERMDSESRKQWELSLTDKTYPKFEELRRFLEQRCLALEVSSQPQGPINSKLSQARKPPNTAIKVHSVTTNKCPACDRDHFLFRCEKFLKLEPRARSIIVRDKALCFNCLRGGHAVTECKSSSSCRQCEKRHNTLLHFHQDRQTRQLPSNDDDKPIMSHVTQQSRKEVLLATARAWVINATNGKHQCRILFDGASQASFVREAFVKRLALPRQDEQLTIFGIGHVKSSKLSSSVQLLIKSCHSDYVMPVDAIIIKQITGMLPNNYIDTREWTHVKELPLADPEYNIPSDIDILIGADWFYDVLKPGQAHNKGKVCAQDTHFGWVVCGPIQQAGRHTSVQAHLLTVDIQTQLQQFWQLEEVKHERSLSLEEKQCEDFFTQTVHRTNEGRYVVALPFKQDISELGESKSLAMKRLRAVEKRLEFSPERRSQYHDFMTEYERLGHMTKTTIKIQDEEASSINYLPHHFVIKAASTTTNLRVVFDASAKTSTGISLNDKLKVGAKLQDDIFDLITRFRCHKYAFAADIAKMYRQILIREEDRVWQHIMWRENPTDPISIYSLNTVTYGTASAPFLATRTLQQLAADQQENCPSVSSIIKKDFYVDDLLSGAPTIPMAIQFRDDMCTMLQGGGFELRKWISNHPEIIASLPAELRASGTQYHINPDATVKTLGIMWNPTEDVFTFEVNQSTGQNEITKRSMLSETARLFDPLGWLAPVIVKAKLLLQQLWLAGIAWDDNVPDHIAREWNQWRSQLSTLQELTITRYTGWDTSTTEVQLHGFCDASQNAYGAVIYSRVTCNADISITLLCAKTKVAPLKQVSLPRLELCAATLLARLMSQVQQAITLETAKIYAWSDSTVTLAWIGSHPARWKPFVANRVSEIQGFITPESWRHVPTHENPADLASRGTHPASLGTHPLWWSGPEFLQKDESQWPAAPLHTSSVTLEEKKNIVAVTTTTQELQWPLTSNYSSLHRLQRVTAYILRFVYNTKSSASERRKGELTPVELNEAHIHCIRAAQADAFAELLQVLKKGVDKGHQYKSLNPFMDQQGVIRVGGRLNNAQLNYDHKHPYLLPRKHPLSKLIICQYHRVLLHPGVDMLLYTIRQRYWIIGGRSVIRSYTFNCMHCYRDKAKHLTQQMGDLPSARVQQARPFRKTGIDFGGPLKLATRKGRGATFSKCYIAVFVCMVTKAIHLELVTDLTTAGFLAAFRRFIARRGYCSEVFSDNGTNFVGADRELRQFHKLLSTNKVKGLSSNLTELGITWHFNPPGAPHFGGLWEAAVKSVKRHIRRVTGCASLTFEEWYTLLTQVEACLNSRPLCPMSSDPNDVAVLTPGHFLIGESLMTLPEPDLTEVKVNRLQRWQLVQQMMQTFWRRWSNEYLHHLQQRPKWQSSTKNIQVGDLVLLREDTVSPLRWKLGRVIEVHPGRDKLVRVATLRTRDGVVKRPIVKLALVPTDNDKDS